MDTSNLRPTQDESGVVGGNSIESGDWRTHLQADYRQRTVNKIMDSMKVRVKFSGDKGLQELNRIAVMFEEKIYTAATSQSDYVRKITFKMLTMETISQDPVVVSGNSMEFGDWRAQLQADNRKRIVNKITDTLKMHIQFSGDAGLQEIKKIAARFEEKIYTVATSQSDYLRKISLKMLTVETRSQNPMPDAMQSNSAATSINPSDPGAIQAIEEQLELVGSGMINTRGIL